MKPILTTLTLALSLGLVACSPPPAPPAPPPAPTAPPPPPPPAPFQVQEASATLAPTQGQSVSGSMKLSSHDAGVHIVGTITGVKAGDTHAFHVHETGDCSAPDGTSAGPHFNPGDHAHGQPDQGEHHLGDMPNQVADDSGTLKVDVTIAGATLRDGGPNDLIGRAFIVHAQPDDYTSQPSGNAGARIACGVIQ